ncbi:MAG: YkvA family protein [Chthoniobacterales bacterium]|jgi:uncharacterized membrane protein YkvA (DUF1232 family)
MTTPTPEQAVSLDEYIDQLRANVTAADLVRMRKHLRALRAKAEKARADGHVDLVAGIGCLAAILESPLVAGCKDPLPKHLAEAGAAATYLLKGIDLIPDSLPEIGLSDDAWIVGRVFQRNPGLQEMA